jgi:hypothetical protein
MQIGKLIQLPPDVFFMNDNFSLRTNQQRR